ncbi:uncharacterized protein Nmlp_2360 [Natronomonas moolapensis 8.8.11]|uniref:Uncharacterized protein n=1 Tax=Natronomonas moolapensis (strain DSM 18674 / CECT 7526 / JCM 14361 / 8.8.11) TaxID=268739 RepID=M1Y239_NATM8|nr:uncharacterized protein Nmlp_2360 [Natronomonas moolapensis 8.8.11]
MPWADLFERAEAYEVETDAIGAALRGRRERE